MFEALALAESAVGLLVFLSVAYLGGELGRLLTVSDASGDAVERFLEQRRVTLQSAYEHGELPLSTFEDRLVVVELPGTEQIMRDAVAIDGIGPHTAFALARHFDGDLEAYRKADQAALEAVNGIGPNRAGALIRHRDGVTLATTPAATTGCSGG